MLVSSTYEHNYLGISVLGEIFSWPQGVVEAILTRFDQPYDYLLINFVKPYVNYF
jgi:hypothetical protein